MNFTLAITTRNRINYLKDSLPYHSSFPEIDEIVVNDDVSNDYNEIQKLNIPKVKCFKNEINLGVFRNKLKTACLSSNNWIILFDSDNRLTRKYTDTLNNMNLDENVVYCPTFAMPELNYESLNDTWIDKNNFIQYLTTKRVCEAAFNTCNFVLSKKVAITLKEEAEKYIQKNSDIPTSYDSIVINYLIVKNNFKLFFPKNMHYDHACHTGSYYIESVKKSKSLSGVIKTLDFKD